MDIEAIVKKYERLIPAGAYTLGEGIRAALTELSETHAIELRAYEATVENLEGRIRELERDQRRPDGLQAESVINNLKRRNKWLSDSIVRMVATQPEDESAPQNQENSND